MTDHALNGNEDAAGWAFGPGGSYANATAQWSSLRGAVEGSSNLKLPRVLNWFFADISFHSIHLR